MLDVHAPEHRIGGVRDFLMHLFTITIGLLIALALENAAEAVHHRHQRLEAEALLREEITHNRNSLLEAAPEVRSEIEDLRKVLDFTSARSLNRPADASGLHLRFSEGSLPDAAWRTANSTNAVSLMPYQEVEHFSAAYKEQELLQTTAEATLNDFLELGSFMPPSSAKGIDISAQEAAAALPYVRHALAHLEGMYDIGTGLKSSYDEALKP